MSNVENNKPLSIQDQIKALCRELRSVSNHMAVFPVEGDQSGYGRLYLRNAELQQQIVDLQVSMEQGGPRPDLVSQYSRQASHGRENRTIPGKP